MSSELYVYIAITFLVLTIIIIFNEFPCIGDFFDGFSLKDIFRSKQNMIPKMSPTVQQRKQISAIPEPEKYTYSSKRPMMLDHTFERIPSPQIIPLEKVVHAEKTKPYLPPPVRTITEIINQKSEPRQYGFFYNSKEVEESTNSGFAFRQKEKDSSNSNSDNEEATTPAQRGRGRGISRGGNRGGSRGRGRGNSRGRGGSRGRGNGRTQNE